MRCEGDMRGIWGQNEPLMSRFCAYELQRENNYPKGRQFPASQASRGQWRIEVGRWGGQGCCHRGCLGQPGAPSLATTPNTLFGNPTFRYILTFAPWCLPSQTAPASSYALLSLIFLW